MPTPKFTETLAVSSGVPAFLASTPASLADSLIFRVAGASVQWADTATANASIGMPHNPADLPVYYEGTASALNFYSPISGAVIHVSYYQGRFRL